MVPVIVNAILNEHQIIVDIVAFVNKGDFPRSRLGEKQRGKLLAGWVTRKMRTLAQFSIRDVDPGAMGETSGVGGVDSADGRRVSMVSARSSGVLAPAAPILANTDQAPRILEHDEFEQQIGNGRASTVLGGHPGAGFGDYRGGDGQGDAGLNSPQLANMRASGGYDLSDYNQFGAPQQPPPHIGPKPTGASSFANSQAPPKIRLPGVDGRESVDFWGNDDKQGEDSWEADAIMHMNLTGEIHSPR